MSLYSYLKLLFFSWAIGSYLQPKSVIMYFPSSGDPGGGETVCRPAAGGAGDSGAGQPGAAGVCRHTHPPGEAPGQPGRVEGGPLPQISHPQGVPGDGEPSGL